MTSSPPLIRRALPQDNTAIADLFMKVWRDELSALAPPGFMDRFSHSVQAQKYAQRAVDTDWVLLVAEVDGHIAGMIGAKVCELAPYEREIHSLYIDPAFQHRGIGASLLKDVINEYKRTGVRNAMLWCIAANSKAGAFYEKHGGRRTTFSPVPEDYRAMEHVIYVWDDLSRAP